MLRSTEFFKILLQSKTITKGNISQHLRTGGKAVVLTRLKREILLMHLDIFYNVYQRLISPIVHLFLAFPCAMSAQLDSGLLYLVSDTWKYFAEQTAASKQNNNTGHSEMAYLALGLWLFVGPFLFLLKVGKQNIKQNITKNCSDHSVGISVPHSLW